MKMFMTHLSIPTSEGSTARVLGVKQTLPPPLSSEMRVFYHLAETKLLPTTGSHIIT